MRSVAILVVAAPARFIYGDFMLRGGVTFKSYNGGAVVVLLIGKADFLNNFVDVRNDALDDDVRVSSLSFTKYSVSASFARGSAPPRGSLPGPMKVVAFEGTAP